MDWTSWRRANPPPRIDRERLPQRPEARERLIGDVMAVLVTAILADMKRKMAPKGAKFHATQDSSRLFRGVDARDKRGHDGVVDLTYTRSP
jgi:hypothetical protein